MAIYIKWQNCTCTECNSSPCDPGCACNFSVEIEPNEDTTYDVTGQFFVATGLSIDIGYAECSYYSGGFHALYVQLKVYANSTLIYDSGCVTGPISTSVTVPAGTTSLRLVNVYDCLGLCESGGSGNPNAYFACV